jgi:peptidoglycan/LPS O-acetylase OafA/YrhL
MQGTLRLYLALCVVQGHMWQIPGIPMFDAPLGELWASAPFAVVGFFLVSGFVAGMQIDGRFFDGSRVDAWRYYRDRLLRIYPTYLLVVVLAAPIYFAWSDWGPRHAWNEPAQWLAFALTNLLPPFMDLWQMLSGRGFDYMVVPVAWSLGNELCFYAVAPTMFLILRGRLMPIGLGLLAIAEPFLRYRSPAVNYLDPLFNLKYFVAGMLAYFVARRLPRLQIEGWLIPTAMMLVFLALARPLSVYSDHNSPEAIRFYSVVLVAIVASSVLVRVSKLDLLLGHFSYPLFLIHVPVMWAVKAMDIGAGLSRFLTVWAASLAASGAIYFLFDRAVNRVRVKQPRLAPQRMAPPLNSGSEVPEAP